MHAFYLLDLLLVTGAALYLVRIPRPTGPQFEISPSVVLVISYFLYASALPISRLLLGVPLQAEDDVYFVPHLLGALGLLVGLVIAEWSKPSQPQAADFDASEELQQLRLSWVIIAVTAALGWQLYILLVRARFSIDVILSPYGATEEGLEFSGGIVGVLTTISANLLIGLLVLSVPGVRGRRGVRRVVYAVAAFVVILFIVRGNRNLAGMLLLPIVAIHLRGRRIPARLLLGGVLTASLLLYALGFIRNFGFGDFRRAASSFSAAQVLDPLNGEFGTSYSVFTKWHDTYSHRELKYGETYTVGVLMNLVPRTLWRDRPPTPSEQISLDYYRTNKLELGLGFSPVVEAMMNFGVLGVLPIFAFFAFVVRRLDLWLPEHGAAGMAVYGFVLPAIVNWNRIDMATNLKIFFLFITVVLLVRYLFYRRASSGAPAFEARPAVGTQ